MTARWLVPLALASLLPAEELPRGSVANAIECSADPAQSYALYLPSNYSPKRSWPILYCLDPRARGRIPVQRFSQAAERDGFIVVGSNNSRNGPIGPVKEAISALVADTHRRFLIDDARTYAAGFSGGARMALAWAGNGQIAGVVASGAGFGERIPERIPFRLYMAVGRDDFNHDEMWEASLTLAKHGVPHRFALFDGDHEWLPAEQAAEALDFFVGTVGPKAAEDSPADRKQAARFIDLSGRIWSGDASPRPLLDRLRRDAARPTDTPDRRVARRVVGGTFIGAIERAQSRLEARDYRTAARLFEIAIEARPDSGGAWYNLAVAHGGAGNKAQALKALKQAVAQGFRDVQRMEREPLLAEVRGDPHYAALTATLPASAESPP